VAKISTTGVPRKCGLQLGEIGRAFFYVACPLQRKASDGTSIVFIRISFTADSAFVQ
jgi:hypothetical protein